MIILLAFWLFCIGSVLVGWQAGNRRDRQIISFIVSAAIATSIAHLTLANDAAIFIVFGIDLLLLFTVGQYALSGERYWPLWFAGFHAAGLLISPFSVLWPDGPYWFVVRIGSFWSIAALGAMTMGLLLDRRNGIVANA